MGMGDEGLDPESTREPTAVQSNEPTEKSVSGPGVQDRTEAVPKPTESTLKRTLQYVEADLLQMLSALPIPLNGVLPKVVVRYMARVLHRGRYLATDILYDVSLTLLRTILLIFFREVQPRSAWHIPAKGPIIFVGAPHHNQFLDPVMVASEVRKTGRRVSFLIAQKSTKRPFIGRLSRMLQSIPVRRAADDAKVGRGVVTMHPSGDPCLLQGIDTEFTQQLQVYGQIVLPKETEYASAHVAEILSDTEVRLVKPFTEATALAALGGQIPACGTNGSRYKCFPHINQTEMYASVYQQLSEQGCLCIFPEGGSHDRTDLLPLKAGVVIMALGAMANDPSLNVQIVPVGLSYFHPHKFRSRAVIEFGVPLHVPPELVTLFKKGGDEKREAIASMLDIVFDGLKSVTVRAPDYDTLMMIQASRRLMTLPGQHLSLADKVEQNRRLIMGYMQFKDHPKVVALRDAVMTYNKHLKQVGIRDHQVERANRSVLRSLVLLLYRLGLLCLWGGCALPGTVLNAPVIILAKVVSHRKAKEALAASQVKLYGRDVLATWKVLVSLGVTPVLYSTYAIIATFWAYRSRLPLLHKRLMPLYVMLGLPILSYGAIKISEVGMDVYKSLPPLIASLLPGRRRVIERIQQERINLTSQLFSTIAELEPEGWNYTDIARGSYTAQAPPRPEELDQLMRHGSAMHSSGGHSLSHPMNVMDEWLFGWRPAQNKAKWGAHRDEVSGDLGPDYEEAMGVFRERASDAAHRRRMRRRSSQDYRQRLKKSSVDVQPDASVP
ncbi:hypothetical protein MNAN1_003684 [Malassezia nana]|uniref:Phospholipid/glycerol acyltransferase domain-containing protein n=1 Tax=Malassezia nana TaxID=180528 RepID=A0AAF0J3Y9_9BASI|nr:hypothetical protein MNAN1_003684 [Malassezia nana]